MFYYFKQNNSGGSFSFDEDEGITHHVVIEADSASDANQDAKEIGIYFYGCSTGQDCDCCGDRWYEVDEYDGEVAPHIHGSSVEDYMGDEWFSRWMEPGKEVCVHYKDGRKEWF